MTQTPPLGLGPGPRRPATLADLEAVPSDRTAHLLGGKLYTFPRPRHRHEKALTRLLVRLGPFDPDASGLAGPGGWLFLVEPELRLGSERAVPDLAGWRREGLDENLLDPYPTIAPAWVCEVLSPSTEVFDRGDKATYFQRIGVSWLWFVDPEAQTLEVYENDAGQFRQCQRRQGAVDVAAPPFDALTWPLGALWG
jgi:Uma2 family endonuclease